MSSINLGGTIPPSVMTAVVQTVRSLLTDPWHTRWIAPCLVLVEAVLCAGIVLKVPCTFSPVTNITPIETSESFIQGQY